MNACARVAQLVVLCLLAFVVRRGDNQADAVTIWRHASRLTLPRPPLSIVRLSTVAARASKASLSSDQMVPQVAMPNNIALQPHQPLLQDCPFYLFINPKSGGLYGEQLLAALGGIVKEEYVCNVLTENPRDKLHAAYRTFRERGSSDALNVLCCGGDGTMKWIMDEAKALGISNFVCFFMLPMGTGNDLTNHLLWMSQERNRNPVDPVSVTEIVQNVTALLTSLVSPANKADALESSVFRLDRWRVRILPLQDSRRSRARARLREKIASAKARVRSAMTSSFRLASKLRFLRPLGLESLRSAAATQQKRLPRWLRDWMERRKSASRFASSTSNPPLSLTFSLPDGTHTTSTAHPPPDPHSNAPSITFNNYFGIGVDGALSGSFQQWRKQRPGLFFSSLVNKLWYALLGLCAIQTERPLLDEATLELFCDGRKVDIARHDLQGIVFCNIRSYAGGTELWPSTMDFPSRMKEEALDTQYDQAMYSAWSRDPHVSGGEQTSPPLFQGAESDDGLLEVVGFRGLIHLASIKTGMDKAIRLAQGKSFKVVMKRYLAMQADGEPFSHRRCVLEIALDDKVNVSLPTTDQDRLGEGREQWRDARDLFFWTP